MSGTVAVEGASRDRRKFGNKAVRAFQHRGYHVIPINPTTKMVEGLAAYPTVLHVTEPIDLATVYLEPRIGVTVMDDLAKKGIKEVWLNPGADGAQVVARAHALGLALILECSIVRIGESPAMY